MVASCALAASGPIGAGCKPSYPEAAFPEQPVPEDPPPFVFAEEAALFVGHDGVSFVDARPAKRYRRGHVPGAVRVDWTLLGGPGEAALGGPLDPDAPAIAATLGDLGLSSGDWTIVVGDAAQGWGEEGRIALALALLGQERVSVLDGGHPAWEAEGRPVQKGTIRRPRRPWEPTPDFGAIARKKDVRRFSDLRGDWEHVLVDTREPEEFRGSPDAPDSGAARHGHVPGAVGLPWRRLLDESGRLLSPAELESILIPLGVRPDAHLIVYCTGGVRSAHTWWVLHGLGYPDVRWYAGSFWEWSLDRKLPIERGGQRPPPPAPPWPPPGDDDSAEDDDSAGR